jgi:FMN phosphatase YigB (HAD superfamily)
LSELVNRGHSLALVTCGQSSFQREKIERAGLEPGLFSKIVIVNDGKKKPHYEDLMRQHSIAAADCCAVGDRAAVDLRPAHELGWRTVLMRWGRGRNCQIESWIDYSVGDLSELHLANSG